MNSTDIFFQFGSPVNIKAVYMCASDLFGVSEPLVALTYFEYIFSPRGCREICWRLLAIRTLVRKSQTDIYLFMFITLLCILFYGHENEMWLYARCHTCIWNIWRKSLDRLWCHLGISLIVCCVTWFILIQNASWI